MTIGRAGASEEKFELYRRYVHEWHCRDEPETADGFESFLYDSPLDSTVEFQYRDVAARLLAVGICDVCTSSLSSVYFYFDPADSKRGLGTFGAIKELEFAKSLGLRNYYLGYWVDGCGAMQYKQTFVPNEILHADGVWRPHRE